MTDAEWPTPDDGSWARFVGGGMLPAAVRDRSAQTFRDETDNGMWPVLDVGVVHDSVLNRRNDLRIFGEQRLALWRRTEASMVSEHEDEESWPVAPVVEHKPKRAPKHAGPVARLRRRARGLRRSK